MAKTLVCVTYFTARVTGLINLFCSLIISA